jgi:hypothetical protein
MSDSALKRRLAVPPGGRRRSLVGYLLSVWDQGDLVVGVWLAPGPLWVMPLPQVAISFAVVSVIHVALSGAGYALGARRTVL